MSNIRKKAFYADADARGGVPYTPFLPLSVGASNLWHQALGLCPSTTGRPSLSLTGCTTKCGDNHLVLGLVSYTSKLIGQSSPILSPMRVGRHSYFPACNVFARRAICSAWLASGQIPFRGNSPRSTTWRWPRELARSRFHLTFPAGRLSKRRSGTRSVLVVQLAAEYLLFRFRRWACGLRTASSRPQNFLTSVCWSPCPCSRRNLCSGRKQQKQESGTGAH